MALFVGRLEETHNKGFPVLIHLIHPRQRVKAKWNSDFRFGGKTAAASNKASHAASKSLLFSFVLDTFQAISVIFLTVQETKKNIRPLDLLVRKICDFYV